MFGFIRPNNPDLKAKPAAAQPDAILVCKEDIYRENRGMEPILLVRKGYEVKPEELPRFIRNGARPQQFHFKPGAGQDTQRTLPIPAIPPRNANPVNKGSSIPIAPPAEPGGNRAYTARNRHKALILEQDPKSMKRLIDCLFICGLQLDRIHPVRVTEHLGWALNKYRPHILVVDYHLQGGHNGLEAITSLQKLPGVEKAILTLAPHPILSEAENRFIEEFCREKNIKILSKPVSRHSLNRILQDS